MLFNYPNTPEQILGSHDQLEIVSKFITGSKPIPHKKVCSPFRPDNHPNAKFVWYGNRLIFKDFADEITHRDIFRMIMDYHNVTRQEAIDMIEEGNIPLLDKPLEIKEPQVKQSFPIYTEKRGWQNRDKWYWKEYGVGRSQLEQLEIFPIDRFTYYSIWYAGYITIRTYDPAYCYYYNEHDVKIYRPFHSDQRFHTNLSNNAVGGRDNPFRDHITITKSFKDSMVLTNAGINNLWFQSERIFPDKEVMENRLGLYRNITIWFDNDKTGIASSQKLHDLLQEQFPSTQINQFRLEQEDYKDPAAYFKKFREWNQYQARFTSLGILT